jgi:hypothetical protein
MVSLAIVPVATFATVFAYVVITGLSSVGEGKRMAAILTPGLLMRSVPIAMVVSSILAAVWPDRKYVRNAVMLLLGALGGLVFGWSAAGRSPHVSQTIAAMCGGGVWFVATLIPLLVQRMARPPLKQ